MGKVHIHGTYQSVAFQITSLHKEFFPFELLESNVFFLCSPHRSKLQFRRILVQNLSICLKDRMIALTVWQAGLGFQLLDPKGPADSGQ